LYCHNAQIFSRPSCELLSNCFAQHFDLGNLPAFVSFSRPVSLKPNLRYSPIAVGFSLNTQRVISSLPVCPRALITSASNLLPTPLPALSGETYSENKWPRLSSSASMPKLAKPKPTAPSVAIKVARPGFGLTALESNLVAASISMASRTFSLIKFRYEMFQHARKIVTNEPKSWLFTGRIFTFASLVGAPA